MPYHLQSDGQSERTNQILKYMLQTSLLDFGAGWQQYLPMAEFDYNNSYQTSIEIAPYEAVYGRKCRSPLHWDEVRERVTLGPDVV